MRSGSKRPSSPDERDIGVESALVAARARAFDGDIEQADALQRKSVSGTTDTRPPR